VTPSPLFLTQQSDAQNYWHADISIPSGKELRYLDVWGRDDYPNGLGRYRDLVITLYDDTGGSVSVLFTSSSWDGVSTTSDNPASFGRFDFVAAGAMTAALTGAKSVRIDHSPSSGEFLELAEVRAAAIPEPSSAVLFGLAGLAMLMIRRRK